MMGAFDEISHKLGIVEARIDGLREDIQDNKKAAEEYRNTMITDMGNLQTAVNQLVASDRERRARIAGIVAGFGMLAGFAGDSIADFLRRIFGGE